MEIESVSNFNKDNRAFKFITAISIICFFAGTLYMYNHSTSKVEASFEESKKELQNKRWGIDPTSGIAFQMTFSEHTPKGRLKEFENHLKLTMDGYYNLKNGDNIREKWNKTSYLVTPRVGLRITADLENKDTRKSIIQEKMQVTPIFEKIEKTYFDGKRMTGIIYAQLKISKPKEIVFRRFDHEFEIADFAMESNIDSLGNPTSIDDLRTSLNPHAAKISKWSIINDKIVETIKKN